VEVWKRVIVSYKPLVFIILQAPRFFHVSPMQVWKCGKKCGISVEIQLFGLKNTNWVKSVVLFQVASPENLSTLKGVSFFIVFF